MLVYHDETDVVRNLLLCYFRPHRQNNLNHFKLSKHERPQMAVTHQTFLSTIKSKRGLIV